MHKTTRYSFLDLSSILISVLHTVNTFLVGLAVNHGCVSCLMTTYSTIPSQNTLCNVT